jgi:hypothetical protein
MTAIEIGRLLRAGNAGFVFGCRVNQTESPTFGDLVNVPLDNGEYCIYGLIHDIRIDDDGLVRQLVTADGIDESVINDNRVNRNVPLEVSVLSVGYKLKNRYYHLLPPKPPLSLDVIKLCEPEELCQFTSTGRYGYFRHVLRAGDLPVGELLAAHFQQAKSAHSAVGDKDWAKQATKELIVLLRDDYANLMEVLSALGDLDQ